MDINQIIEKMDTGSEAGFRKCNLDESRVDMCLELLEQTQKVSSSRRRVALEEAMSTSDFPYLLGGVINRMLMGQYQTADPVWRKFIRTRTVSDFRTYEVIKDWGAPLLSEVKEHGEYPTFTTSEGKYTGTIKKYGKQYGLSWEMLINDYLGAFNSIASRMTDMAIKTEWDIATRLMTASTGPATGLFGATVSDAADGGAITNKGALPLTIPNLEATLTLMKQQVDKAGYTLMIRPKYLVVPQALEYTARQILNSSFVFATGLASTSSSTLRGQNNVLPQEGLELIVNPWMKQIDTSGKVDATWYLFCDTAYPCAQMTFLSGYETPQVAVKDSGMQGVSVNQGSFENDTIWYRVRHVIGSAVLDPRFAYAQTGS